VIVGPAFNGALLGTWVAELDYKAIPFGAIITAYRIGKFEGRKVHFELDAIDDAALGAP